MSDHRGKHARPVDSAERGALPLITRPRNQVVAMMIAASIVAVPAVAYADTGDAGQQQDAQTPVAAQVEQAGGEQEAASEQPGQASNNSDAANVGSLAGDAATASPEPVAGTTPQGIEASEEAGTQSSASYGQNSTTQAADGQSETNAGEGDANLGQTGNSAGTLSAAESASAGITNAEQLKETIGQQASATISLSGNIFLAELLDVKGDVIIDGHGYTIKRGKVIEDGATSTYTGGFFNVAAGASLTLRNITLDGGAAGWVREDSKYAKDGGGYGRIPCTATGADAQATGALVENSGTLATEDTTFQDAYRITGCGAFVESHAGSTLEIGAGTTFVHGFAQGAAGAISGEKGTKLVVTGTDASPVAFRDNGTQGSGGAISIDSGDDPSNTASISHAVFSNNYAHYNGAGLYCAQDGLGLSNSQFLNNRCGNDGAGLCISQGSSHQGGTAGISNVTFDGNRALEVTRQSMGGAVAVYYQCKAGNISFDNCLFANGDACDGSAVAFMNDPQGGTSSIPVSFKNCIIRNNASSAIYVPGRATGGRLALTMDGCSVIDNNSEGTGNDGKTASTQYAPVYLAGDSTLTITGSTFSTNKSDYGGAIRLYGNAQGAPSLTLGGGTVITGNSARNGGGIYALSFCPGQKCSIAMLDGAKVYANSATNSADDIYAYAYAYGNYQGSIALHLLLAHEMNAQTADGMAIDGWYYDTGNARYKRNDTTSMYLSGGSTIMISRGAYQLKADASTYDVRFNKNADDATGSMDNQGYGFADAKVLIGNMFSRTGYRFKGWATREDGEVAYADHGVFPSDGHAFAGWSRSGSGVDFTYKDSVFPFADGGLTRGSTVDLYAVWDHDYTVAYDANGGRGTMSPQTMEYDRAYNLSANGFTRAGWRFVGWNTTADGSGIGYEEGQEVEGLANDADIDVVLYAQWEKVEEPVPAEPESPVEPEPAASQSPAHAAASNDSHRPAAHMRAAHAAVATKPASIVPQTGDASGAAGAAIGFIGGLLVALGVRSRGRHEA